MSYHDILKTRCKRGHFPAITGWYERKRFNKRTGTAYIGQACRLCRIEDSTAYWRRKGGRAKEAA